MSQALPKVLSRKQNIQYGDDTYPRDLSLILPNQRMHTKFGILPVLSRAHAENVWTNNLSSDVLFHVTSIVRFQLIKSGIQKRQFSQIWFIHRLLNLPLFSKIFHPQKSFPTRLGNKTQRNLLNILSITHALLSKSKIFFEEKFVYTTIARRTAAGSLKTQWWRRLSTNQSKE